MLGASPLISAFYNEPRAGAVAAIASLFLIMTGLTNVHEALLNRQMKFGWVATIGALGMALGFLASLIAALWGAGYWSLVLGFGVQQCVSLLGVWLGVGWIPRERPSFKRLFHFYKFGAAIMAAESATVMAREADSVLIGRYVGGAQLGFYDRGNKLAIIPIQRINTLLQQLLLPILSRLNDDGERYRYAYLRVIRQLMLFLTPGVVAVGATAPVLVPFVLGAQWAPAAPIFAWLTLAALHRPASMSMDLLFISQARMRDYLAWSAFSTLTSVTAFVVGLRWGAVGVAAAFALSDLFVRMPALWWWATRRGPIRLADLYLSATPFAAGAAIALHCINRVVRPGISPVRGELQNKIKGRRVNYVRGPERPDARPSGLMGRLPATSRSEKRKRFKAEVRVAAGKTWPSILARREPPSKRATLAKTPPAPTSEDGRRAILRQRAT